MNIVLTKMRVGEEDLGPLCWGSSSNLKRLWKVSQKKGKEMPSFSSRSVKLKMWIFEWMLWVILMRFYCGDGKWKAVWIWGHHRGFISRAHGLQYRSPPLARLTFSLGSLLLLPWVKLWLFLCFLSALTSTNNCLILAVCLSSHSQKEHKRESLWPRSLKNIYEVMPLAVDQPTVRLLFSLVLILGPVSYGIKRGRDMWYKKMGNKVTLYTYIFSGLWQVG